MSDLKADDIKVGSIYRAKRFQSNFLGKNNDRYVVWISSTRNEVQYDSDTVKDGRHYPTVSMEKFLKWAKEEITKS